MNRLHPPSTLSENLDRHHGQDEGGTYRGGGRSGSGQSPPSSSSRRTTNDGRISINAGGPDTRSHSAFEGEPELPSAADHPEGDRRKTSKSLSGKLEDIGSDTVGGGGGGDRPITVGGSRRTARFITGDTEPEAIEPKRRVPTPTTGAADAADDWPEVESRPGTLGRYGSLSAGSEGRPASPRGSNTGAYGRRGGEDAHKGAVRVEDSHEVLDALIGRADNVGRVEGGPRGGREGVVRAGVAGERRRNSIEHRGVTDDGRGVGDGGGGRGGGKGGKDWDRSRTEGWRHVDSDKKSSSSSSSSGRHAGRSRRRNEDSIKGDRDSHPRMNRRPRIRDGESSDRGHGRDKIGGWGRGRDREMGRDKDSVRDINRGRDRSRDDYRGRDSDRAWDRERDHGRHRHRSTDRDGGGHRDRNRDHRWGRGVWHGIDRWGSDGGSDYRWRHTDGEGARQSRSREYGEPDGRSDDRHDTKILEEQQRQELAARARELEEKVRWWCLPRLCFLALAWVYSGEVVARLLSVSQHLILTARIAW